MEISRMSASSGRSYAEPRRSGDRTLTIVKTIRCGCRVPLAIGHRLRKRSHHYRRVALRSTARQ